jgi:hypothetical protein
MHVEKPSLRSSLLRGKNQTTKNTPPSTSFYLMLDLGIPIIPKYTPIKGPPVRVNIRAAALSGALLSLCPVNPSMGKNTNNQF